MRLTARGATWRIIYTHGNTMVEHTGLEGMAQVIINNITTKFCGGLVNDELYYNNIPPL